jgi:hypothetical protein
MKKIGRTWKGLSWRDGGTIQHLPGRAEDKDGDHQSGYRVPQLRFETSSFKVKVRNVATLANLLCERILVILVVQKLDAFCAP